VRSALPRVLESYRGRFLTTEAVLTEALALLSPRQQSRCLDWLGDASRAGLLEVDRAARDARRRSRDPDRRPARLRRL
jgi:hypothetical protein